MRIVGIVTLGGQADRWDDALRLLVRVRHAEGVIGIRDRLRHPYRADPSRAAGTCGGRLSLPGDAGHHGVVPEIVEAEESSARLNDLRRTFADHQRTNGPATSTPLNPV